MNETAKKWIEKFLAKLRHERNYSAHTIKNYSRDLQSLLRYCEQHNFDDWSSLDDQAIRALISARHRQGLGGASLQRMLSTFRSFFKFLLVENVLTNNPAQNVQAPKTGRKLPSTLDIDSVTRLVEITEFRLLVHLMRNPGRAWLKLREMTQTPCEIVPCWNSFIPPVCV